MITVRGQVAGGRGQGAGGRSPQAARWQRRVRIRPQDVSSRQMASGSLSPDDVMTIRNYADLIAWQKAMTLAEAVYRMTLQMPREERYGLISQMRRAAVSIPSNIAEGEGRGSDEHLLHALRVSYGSLRELETQLLPSGRLRFLSEQDLRGLFDQCEEVGRILNGLMKTVKNRVRAKRMKE
jgi:four helix bundle protein